MGLIADSARPTDAELLRFTQGVELAVVKAYEAARPLLASGAALDLATAFVEHHNAHANAFVRMAGGTAVSSPNPALVTQMKSAMQSAKTERDALAALYELENNVAATHQYLLEHLQDDAAIHEVAAVLPVESQHAAVIGLLLHKDPRDLGSAFQGHDGYYDPTRFPVP